jgi:hypothetical protein
MKRTYLMMAAALCASTIALQAADKPADGQTQRRPGNPLIAALDANSDGTLDATEISNAPAALRKLDKNGDGKLTREELRPARPDGQGRADGERGQRRRQREADAKK